jgi:hypothetical protein
MRPQILPLNAQLAPRTAAFRLAKVALLLATMMGVFACSGSDGGDGLLEPEDAKIDVPRDTGRDVVHSDGATHDGAADGLADEMSLTVDASEEGDGGMQEDVVPPEVSSESSADVVPDAGPTIDATDVDVPNDVTSDDVSNDDVSIDGGSPDTAADSPDDQSASQDGPVDGAPLDSAVDSSGDAGECTAQPDGHPCTLPGPSLGLCASGVCSACAGAADDAKCTTAYGNGATHYLCIAGACSVGDCRGDADCAGAGKAGQICGLQSPNQCGKCTDDTHCKAAPGYGATTICQLATGSCVLAACGSAATPQTTQTLNTACSASNPADFCCATGGPLGACVPGNCCSDAQCQVDGGPGGTCRNHTCTKCAAVSNDVYYVDPVAGSDTGSTGSSVCPFKSMARAVQFINGTFGAAIPTGTQILLRSDSLVSNVARNENFPISIPQNVTLSSENGASPRTVEVTNGRTGFNLASPSSGIAALIIDGKSAASSGVAVGGAASNQTTSLVNVTIGNFGNDGILVQGGGLLVGQGVLSTENGQNLAVSSLGAGLHVRAGNVRIVVNAGQSKTGFDKNKGNGILVDNSGSVTLTGTPDVTGYPGNQNPPAAANGTGTVTANENELANLAISQSGGNRPFNMINGLVTWKSKGNGMNLASGSSVGVRNSVSVNNAASGVRISASFNGNITGAPGGPVINLGPDALGKNIFQTPSSGNKAAGICVDGNFNNTNQTLSAKANYFLNRDCSAAATNPPIQLNTSRDGCANGIDVGIERTLTNQQQPNVKVVLDNCQSL